jgi:hypothetical protein
MRHANRIEFGIIPDDRRKYLLNKNFKKFLPVPDPVRYTCPLPETA